MLKNANISHILGIDFGTTKIGLAMADTETKIAFVYAMLKNDEKFLAELGEIIKKEDVERIIIGAPNYINDKKEKSAGEKLGDSIKLMFPQIGIEYQNEMFTTKSAQDNLIEKGMKNVGQYDDAEAAKIILQDFLDKN